MLFGVGWGYRSVASMLGSSPGTVFDFLTATRQMFPFVGEAHLRTLALHKQAWAGYLVLQLFYYISVPVGVDIIVVALLFQDYCGSTMHTSVSSTFLKTYLASFLPLRMA